MTPRPERPPHDRLADHPTARLACVEPDGRVHVAATGLHFPNGTVITADGRCEYERRRQGGASTSISAPIQRFEGDNFVVGVGPFSTTTIS